MSKKTNIAMGASLGVLTLMGFAPQADAQPFWFYPPPFACPVTQAQLQSKLQAAQRANRTGLKNHFWAVVVNRTGVVCAVAFSGPTTGSQWLLSRQIAAAKAFTANGLSLDRAPVSTAALYQWVQSANANIGNPLFGLSGGNVMDSTVAYQGAYALFGTPADPMVGYRVGGTITFGGGLGLYQGDTVVGGLGLSGDTACADHSTAWATRQNLGLAPSPAVSAGAFDYLVFAKAADKTDGHPHCPNDAGTLGSK